MSLTVNDIRYNLQVLAGKRAYPGKGKIAAGQIGAIALEFLSIFAQQINSLPNLNDANGLQRDYMEASDRVAMALGQGMDVEIPLMAKSVISPRQLAATAIAAERAGLGRLPADMRIIRAKGDGHCLFRTFGLGLLRLYQNGMATEKQALLKRIEDLKKEYPSIKTELDDLTDILKENNTPLDVMRSPRTSNYVVKALRKLASCVNARHGSDVFRSDATEHSGSVGRYLALMSDMQEARYAGPSEIQALCQALHVKTHVVDIVPRNRNQEIAFKPAGSQPTLGTLPGKLLHRVNHYDYVVD